MSTARGLSAMRSDTARGETPARMGPTASGGARPKTHSQRSLLDDELHTLSVRVRATDTLAADDRELEGHGTADRLADEQARGDLACGRGVRDGLGRLRDVERCGGRGLAV